MLFKAIFLIGVLLMTCSAHAAPIIFDIDESISAITSVPPNNPLDNTIAANFEFDELKFSGGSEITTTNPITFNGVINQTAQIAPLVNANVNATYDVTYSDTAFDIVTGSTQNGASPSGQSWSVSSNVAVQANGTITVSGFGNFNFSINTVKTVTTSGANLKNTNDVVSLSAAAGGTNIGIPFESALPLNIDASDITVSGNLAGFGNTVKNLIVNNLNAGAPTVRGTVVAHSSDRLDIPEQVSFEILENQSVINVSTAAGLDVSSNLQGTLEGLHNTTSVRIDNSSRQQIDTNVLVNQPLQVLGDVFGVTASSSVDSLALMMEFGIKSDVIQDGSSPALIELMVDTLKVEFGGALELSSLLGTDTGHYVITGTIDPFLLPLSGAQPILLYTDAQYEYLNIPFDMLIDSNFLLDRLTLNAEITDITLLSSGNAADFLLNTLFAEGFAANALSNFSLQGEVLARRRISNVPVPSSVLLFGTGLAALSVWRSRRR